MVPWCGFGIHICRLSPYFLAFKFLRQLTFQPPLFAGLQKEGVSFHFFNDAFLLDLSFKTAQRALNRLAFEHPDFSQIVLREICDQS
jgi:hypothetical protein